MDGNFLNLDMGKAQTSVVFHQSQPAKKTVQQTAETVSVILNDFSLLPVMIPPSSQTENEKYLKDIKLELYKRRNTLNCADSIPLGTFISL